MAILVSELLEKLDAIPKSVLDDIKSELWMEGVNMGGEYQGVWVRFKDIEKIIDKHINRKEQQGENVWQQQQYQ